MTSSPEMAGFANGVMVRYLDCNDSYFSPGGGHPSDMIPAVLALADPMVSDGRSVITAVALAYEVFCRLSDAVVVSDPGVGPRRLRRDRRRLWRRKNHGPEPTTDGARHFSGRDAAPALGRNPHRGTVDVEGLRHGQRHPVGHLCRHPGSRRHDGAIRALRRPSRLLGAGRGAASRTPAFPRGDSRTADDPFRITQTIFKSYPSQIHTQGPIGLAVELRDKVALDDIDSIRINTYKVAASTASSEPEKWDPKTRETADHSIPFLVAAALKDGPVTPATFTDAGIADTSVREIMARMSLVEDPEFTAKYPGEYNSRITITDRSGGVHTSHTAYLKGHPKNPLSDAEVEAKFRAFSSGVLTAQQRGQALEAIWALDSLQNLDDLFDNLVI